MDLELQIGQENEQKDQLTSLMHGKWPDWKLVKRINSGSYGTVFEAVKNDHGLESRSAIKIIPIPRMPSDLDMLRAEGYDEEGTKTYLKDIVDDYLKEIKQMQMFKAQSNIVSIEDYTVDEQEDGLGWCIYIRMELLIPFETYICDKTLTEQDVIKLGVDICTALEMCETQNVIHRDIKPQNLFVTDLTKSYKLGDFGIARVVDAVDLSLSYAGTPLFMAPEVPSGHYDHRVDLYSLGLVLHYLLNNQRAPFLNTDPNQLPTPDERTQAQARRMAGEPLPPPVNASPYLSQAILMACNPDPDKRFKSAASFKTALLSIESSRNPSAQPTPSLIKEAMPEHKPEQLEPADPVHKAPAEPVEQEEKKDTDQQQVTIQTVGSPVYVPSKKKSSKGVIVAIVASILVIAVIIGGSFFVSRFIEEKGEEIAERLESKQADASAIPSTTVSPEKEAEMVSAAIAQAEELAGKEDYKGALTVIQTSLASFPSSEPLLAKQQEYSVPYKQSVLGEADTLVANNDYPGACRVLNEAAGLLVGDEEIEGRRKECENVYVPQVIASVDAALENKDYASAETSLREALQSCPGNEELQKKLSVVQNSKPLNFLTDITPYEANSNSKFTKNKLFGELYSNSLELAYSHLNYNLDGKFDLLEFDIGPVDNEYYAAGTVDFMVDGEWKLSVETSKDMPLSHYSLDVHDGKLLVIDTTGGLYAMVNAVIYPNPEAAQQEAAVPETPNTNVVDLWKDNPPYESDISTTKCTIAGEAYYDVSVFGGLDYAVFNLDGKYNTLEFDMGHVDGSGKQDGQLDIILDGQTNTSAAVGWSDLPKHFVIDLHNAQQMKMELNNTGGGKYAIYNAVLY